MFELNQIWIVNTIHSDMLFVNNNVEKKNVFEKEEKRKKKKEKKESNFLFCVLPVRANSSAES